jgi:hypothetical protein
MNDDTFGDSEERSDFDPSQSISTLAAQVKAYENRVRERLLAKYPTPTPAEAGSLEKEIEQLVQMYAQGRILLQGRSAGWNLPKSWNERSRSNRRDVIWP